MKPSTDVRADTAGSIAVVKTTTGSGAGQPKKPDWETGTRATHGRTAEQQHMLVEWAALGVDVGAKVNAASKL